MSKTVKIRGKKHEIGDALIRKLAHRTQHARQIVHTYKSYFGKDWRSLSIPLGDSEVFNKAQFQNFSIDAKDHRIKGKILWTQ